MEAIGTIVEKQLNMLYGQPVCAVLQDGTYYIGTIQGIKNGELLLHGVRGKGKMPVSSQGFRAKVKSFGGLNPLAAGSGQGSDMLSGLLGGLPGMLQGLTGWQSGGNAPSGGAGGGLFGGLGQGFKIGLNILAFLWPLFAAKFKI
ncbi:MAG TPA: hypothetical protein VF260_12155 [Bacilli bacterium]